MSSQSRKVYVVCPGEKELLDPVAAFSDRSVAEALVGRLNTYIEDGASVVEVDSTENDLEVDRYALRVGLALNPYNVSIHRDGELFDKMDLLGFTLEEPTIETLFDFVERMRAGEIEDPNKSWGIGGTFWAPSSDIALEKAKLLQRTLFEVLQVRPKTT